MAGCFGNSAYDRHLEGELNHHLNKEADYDNFCELVFDKLPDTEEMNDFFETSEVDKILQDSYRHFDTANDYYHRVADKIIAAYNERYNSIS